MMFRPHPPPRPVKRRRHRPRDKLNHRNPRPSLKGAFAVSKTNTQPQGGAYARMAKEHPR